MATSDFDIAEATEELKFVIVTRDASRIVTTDETEYIKLEKYEEDKITAHQIWTLKVESKDEKTYKFRQAAGFTGDYSDITRPDKSDPEHRALFTPDVDEISNKQIWHVERLEDARYIITNNPGDDVGVGDLALEDREGVNYLATGRKDPGRKDARQQWMFKQVKG